MWSPSRLALQQVRRPSICKCTVLATQEPPTNTWNGSDLLLFKLPAGQLRPVNKAKAWSGESTQEAFDYIHSRYRIGKEAID